MPSPRISKRFPELAVCCLFGATVSCGVGGLASGSAPRWACPSPTPYTVVGTNYILGQRVAVGPLHVLVDARPGALVDRPGVPAGTQELYFVDITWLNRSGDPISIDYGERVRLRSVTSSADRVVTDSNWGMSAESLQ